MGEGCSPAPEFCKKGVPFVARLANMGDTGLLVSGSFRKGPLQGAFEGDVMRLAVDPQVGGQEHYHYDGENIP